MFLLYVIYFAVTVQTGHLHLGCTLLYFSVDFVMKKWCVNTQQTRDIKKDVQIIR